MELKEAVEQFKQISLEHQRIVIDELTNFLLKAFEQNINVLNDDMKQMFKEFNEQKGNFELKIKYSIPLLKLLTGLDIEASFDVKGWADKMYEKHQLKIFNWFGYIKKQSV